MKKTTLLAVVGLSPQVVTETLYALHQNGRTIDAIHLISTREGKDKILTMLIGGGKGRYYEYLQEYGFSVSAIDFGPHNIHVITDEHGNEIPDIAGMLDNERLLEKCLELTFRLTSDPDNAVLFSVAGGRKTMSSCLTLAAEMYGRPQDRLYHVLISPEFESNRDFYYPYKESRAIKLKDEKGEYFYKESKYAQVNLINMPFVSIRQSLTAARLDRPMDPGTLMLSVIKDKKPQLTIDLRNRKIIYCTIELDLSPLRLAIYTFFADQKKKCTKEQKHCTTCKECYLDFNTIEARPKDLTDIYRKISGSRSLDEMAKKGIRELDGDNFRSYKSKLTADLRHRFGPDALKIIGISTAEPEGKNGTIRYGIEIDKTLIEISY
ncbi:MAG: CRISPR-associated ring nuclease Csm6 [Desulfobacteraceae bacterium]|nr:CRISPR-associated ring nuclease Csm6 [Desulfobacteraceae bacterium]